MANYVVLFNLTHQGIQNIAEGPTRVEKFKELCRSRGAAVTSFYLVMGRYDAIAILEAPDDQTVAKLTLELGALGNVRTETLRGFTEDEYRKIIAK